LSQIGQRTIVHIFLAFSGVGSLRLLPSEFMLDNE